MSRRLVGWLFLAGALLFGGGYALLEQTRGVGPTAGLARLVFWGGLGLVLTAAWFWITLPVPPRRRSLPDEEPEREGADLAADDKDDLIPCPHCREMIYEESERCPACGAYISVEDAPSGTLPGWVIVGAVLALLVTIFWILTGN